MSKAVVALALALGTALAIAPAARSGSTGLVAQSAMSDSNPGATAVSVETQPLNLVSVDAKTTGTGRIVVENGKSYVQLSEDFTIGEAPAIRMTLYKDATPPQKTYDAKKYVDLGALVSRKGAQRYAIPANLKVKDYGSIAIWCKKFDVTLAYAKIDR
ncbi:DM13 domain-containing protein [Gloeobacter morelensis]|uniref:DM13 domain-containing protein n=1 Tax=Gloeobacter morelensis MG652769 TaxID=2781736 RepID=A0ABY3PMK0_9CYAN|nr:DM13 domain-containing protein [Gloeobacter morelensis]UFP94918.1 DM13 domain-containing protein [Gloeobacter morelensis MG652769]